jgi:hypothetical protein
MDMLGLYRAVSGIISETIAKDGQSQGFHSAFYC